MRHGIIYDSSWKKTCGEVIISPVETQSFSLPSIPHPFFHFPSSLPNLPSLSTVGWSMRLPTIQIPYEIWRGTLQGVGIGLILASIAGFGSLVYPIIASEVGYRATQLSKVFAKEDVAPPLLPEINRAEELEKKQKEYAAKVAAEFGIENTQFSIYIPKIDARAAVVENVNPADEAAYTAALKLGVAHALGTSVPGASGGTFIFAHSTNAPWNIATYNAVFYLLKELSPEDHDEVYIFYQDRAYKYRVAEKQVVPAEDVSWITNATSGPERLILQTCWPPGTSWKRLIVVAYPEDLI